jgi:rfaE bifunctional protein kinase chain/domain
VRSINGEIRYTSDVTFSSSALLNEHFPLYTEEQIDYLKKLKGKYSFSKIRDSIEKLSKLKVLLVGEIIVDEYIYCDAIGKSGKEPVLVTKKLRQEAYAGGILAIANHLSDFCKDITVVSYLGDQSDQGDFIQKRMKENIKLDTVVKKGSPTIVKRRYVDSYTKAKLLGVYEINDEMISPEEEEQIASKLKPHLKNHDVVIVADYGHGLISEKIVNLLCQESKYLAVNTQMNASNIGYHTISKYPRADYVCIHSGELRHEYRTRTKDEKELIYGLYDRMKCETLVVTKGVHGSLSYRKKEGFVSCPAFASNIIDRVGAGDTLLAITSACFGAGLSTDISLLLGNLAAAEKIGMMGTGTAVSKTKVLKTMEAMLK